MNWLIAGVLLLALTDLHWLRMGASADEICCGEEGRFNRTKTSANEPFRYKPVTIPVKVHCSEAPKPLRKLEPGVEEVKILNEVRAKQKMKNEAGRLQDPQQERQEKKEETIAVPLKNGKYSTSGMTAECEQCEIQIKANGDGIFLKCRKCHPADGDGFRFPNPSPNRVVQLP